MRFLIVGGVNTAIQYATLVPLSLFPLLLMLRITEKLGIKLPISSENLLGLKHLPSADSLARIGIEVRPAEESLRAVLGG